MRQKPICNRVRGRLSRVKSGWFSRDDIRPQTPSLACECVDPVPGRIAVCACTAGLLFRTSGSHGHEPTKLSRAGTTALLDGITGWGALPDAPHAWRCSGERGATRPETRTGLCGSRDVWRSAGRPGCHLLHSRCSHRVGHVDARFSIKERHPRRRRSTDRTARSTRFAAAAFLNGSRFRRGRSCAFGTYGVVCGGGVL